MAAYAEILVVLAAVAVGVRWYRRTSMHQARKRYGVHPPEVARHDFGWGGPLLPRGPRDHRKESEDEDMDQAP